MAKILGKTHSPYVPDADTHSLTLRASQEWEKICEDVMAEILRVKFSTVDICKKFLVDTGTKRLYEGTGDRKWGCGIPISKYWLITPTCPGKNILGLQLEEVRGTIK